MGRKRKIIIEKNVERSADGKTIIRRGYFDCYNPDFDANGEIVPGTDQMILVDAVEYAKHHLKSSTDSFEFKGSEIIKKRNLKVDKKESNPVKNPDKVSGRGRGRPKVEKINLSGLTYSQKIEMINRVLQEKGVNLKIINAIKYSAIKGKNIKLEYGEVLIYEPKTEIFPIFYAVSELSK